MKNIYKILTFCMVAVLIWSCEKDENRVYFEGGTAPVATPSRTGTIPLSFATANDVALKLSWTNPNYTFTTGVSSQNVSYTIEIDTTGANFTNPKKKSVSISSGLEKSFTQTELNDYLLNTLELKAGMPHNIEMRVIASLAAGASPLASNVMKFVMTPYAIPPKVTPYTNEVYLVGDATPGGWNNPVPSPSQKMTQVSPTLYEIVTPLVGGKSMLLLPENGSWSRKYGFAGSNNANNPEGDEFTREGGDIKVPDASGTYKITLNFQTGRFSIVKQ